MIGLLLALALPAQAEGPEAWASLYDGRLSQSMDRDPSAAIAIYETLLSGMADNDPMRGDILYWLGRARMATGDMAGAMQTLGSAKQMWFSRSRSRALLGRLVAQQQAVRRMPYSQDLRQGTTPWVRGWERGRDEDLAIEKTTRGPVAAWRTEVRDGEDDFLTFAVQTDGAPMEAITLSVQASEFPAVVQLWLADDEGVRWRAPIVRVETGSWTDIDLAVTDFSDADDQEGRGVVDGAKIQWVSLRDVTSRHAEDRGENRLMINGLSIK